MLMLQGDWLKARDAIEAALTQIVQLPRVASDAQIDLATCYRQLALKFPGDEEDYKAKRVASLNSAVRANPNSNRARVALAQAQSEDESEDRDTRLRRVEETLSKVEGNTAEILVLRARLAASAELRKPASERAWDQIDEMLKKAEETDPDSPRLLATWVEIDVARNTPKTAEKRLDDAIAAHPDRVNLRIARAFVAREQGLVAEELTILDEAEREAVGSRARVVPGPGCLPCPSRQPTGPRRSRCPHPDPGQVPRRPSRRTDRSPGRRPEPGPRRQGGHEALGQPV